MESSIDYDRLRELMAKKKKLMAKIRRCRKEQVKARIEKRKINDEIRKLRGKKNLFSDMEHSDAAELVKKTIESVDPNDIYPKDLEREFDKIDKPAVDKKKTLDLGKIKEQPLPVATRGSSDEDDTVDGVVGDSEEPTEEEGVLDFSDL